jgi:hypothetical protein
MKLKIPHWHVKPAAAAWTVETPDGTIIDCATGSVATELGSKLAQKGRGCVLVYGSDGRIKAGEDFSGTFESFIGVH